MHSDTQIPGASGAANKVNRYAEVGVPGAADAAESFSQWWNDCSARGRVRMPSPQLMEVDASLSAEFMIGLFGRRFFIGIPPSTTSWFSKAPWIHVAVRPGSSGLALVCGSFGHRKRNMREFALYFPGVPTEVVNNLSTFHYIDVREIVEPRTISVHSTMVLEVIPVAGDLTFETFASGQSSTSFHRNQFAQRQAA